MKKITFIRTALIAVIMAFACGTATATVVTVGGGATVTGSATPTATWTTPPTGVTFSNWSRGSGVTWASASDALSGSNFAAASAAASYTANTFYKVTISADLSTSFTLTDATWLTTVSGTGATCSFEIYYKNNGGTLTKFGTSTGTSITTNSFTGSVTVSAGTSLEVFMIPFVAKASTSTVRWKNGSTFTLTATAANSNDATLSAMTISAGTLAPAFASATTSYTATVSNATSSITVTPTRNQANATIQARVNGGTYASVSTGTASGSLALNVGANTVDVLVTAQDGTTTKTYTTTVTRQSNDATLSAMSISAGTLSPSFASGTITYTATVPYTSSSMTVTPTRNQANATIQARVNGGSYASVTSGSASGSLALNVGVNTVDVLVTAQDGTTKTYTTTVTRTAVATDATLSAMTISAGTLSPSFASGTITYTASVGNGTGSITVTPTQTNAFASIQVRVNSGTYATVTSGTASGSLSLSVGDNPIDVKVTAQDGSTINTYTVTVTRAAAAVPTIAASGTLSAVSTTYGTASASPASFSVSGAALSANILITPPSGFEVSQTSGGASGYAATQTLTQAGGVVSSTTVYVRLKATATVAGSPYSGNVVLTSTGAADVNVATASSAVSPYALTVSGLSGVNKQYDGGTTASLTGSASLSAAVNSDVISLGGSAVGSFVTASVADSKTVNITGLSISGTNSTSYSLTAPTTTANITAAPLTITGITGTTKQYDGTTSTTITGTAAYSGLVAGESTTPVSGTPVATFVDATVGTGKTITVTGYTPYSSNYTLTQPTLSADITKADQTITFGVLTSKSIGDAKFKLTASASSSLAITYVSSNLAVATITGDSVTIVGQGSVDITASQAGNTNYNAATDVIQNLTVQGAPILSWQFGNPASAGNEASYNATSNNSNLNTSTLSRGAGVAAATLANGFSANTWDGTTKANAVTNDEYYTFAINAKVDYKVSLSTLDVTLRRSGTGPNAYIWKYSLDGSTFTEIGSDISFTSTSSSGVAQSQIDLSGISDLQSVSSTKTITFRLYAWGATGTGGSLAIGKTPTSTTTSVLTIGGSVVSIPTGSNTPTSSAKIYSSKGQLTVSGVSEYTVYNAQGVEVANVKGANDYSSVALRSGVYFVKVAGKTQKVMIK